jgi:hypothetical protein
MALSRASRAEAIKRAPARKHGTHVRIVPGPWFNQANLGHSRVWLAWWRCLDSCMVARAFVWRTIRAVKIVVRDGRVPRPIRWGGALGLLPVPGPLDEVVLLVVAGVLWIFYRDQLSEAWAAADSSPPASDAA